jgi:NAD(P)-dependent dehydrogenase (short-subunit alcohol dehydrogenase family)
MTKRLRRWFAKPEKHASAVADQAGGIDVCFNAVGIPQKGVQGIPLLELSAENFAIPIVTYTRAHFLTARAAARHMIKKGSGVILTITATPARSAFPLVGGMAPAWAAMEALSRSLAAELGPHGIRVICLRSSGTPETAVVQEVIGLHAKGTNMTRDQMQALLEGQTLLRRLPKLAEIANAAAFLASDRAGAMTGTVANLTCGAVVD